MNAPEQLARRHFLQLSGAAGGLLLLFGAGGEVAAAQSQPAVAALTAPLLNSWIRIAPDGSVALYSNISELGQGTGSALAQLIAEELEVPWQSIRIEMAPIAKAYFTTPDNYFTDSSRGVSAQFDSLRKVGATARMLLVQAASARWQADAAACHAEAGMVVHAASGRRLGYGEIAAEAAALPLPPADSVKLKPREAWRLIGSAPPRLDLPAKVDGSAVFGIDVTLPGMLMAAIAHCPVFGGTLVKVDEKPALAVRGVKKVVRLESAVAVVADSYWQAKKGLAALKPEWQVRGAQRDSAAMDAQLLASANSGKALVLGTDTVAAGEQAMQRLQTEGHLHRALPCSCDDGTDERYRAGLCRSRRAVVADPGAARQPQRRGRSTQAQTRAGHCAQHPVRRRLRAPRPGGFRAGRGACRARHARRAGEADLEPRRGHAAWLLSARLRAAAAGQRQRGRLAAHAALPFVRHHHSVPASAPAVGRAHPDRARHRLGHHGREPA
jgi:hypothetical protein